MKKATVKKLMALMMAGAMCVGMTACGSDAKGGDKDQADAAKSVSAASETAEAAEEEAEAAEESGELKEIDVVLDWYPNAIHTFLYDAIDKGYFEEEGLKVNIIDPAESVDGINFVATGRAEIGLTYTVEICQAQEQGMPVKALGAICQKELDCICSLADNDEIKDLSDMKGHKVGYSGTGAEEAIIQTIMTDLGLTEDDFELVNVGYDLVTSLTTESVDLAGGIFINDEVPTMELEGYEVNVFSEQDYGVPRMYGLVMAVNTDNYDADPEMYQGFINACKKGFADMKADEDAALETIMTDMNSDENPLDEEQQRQSYRILMDRMETEDGEFLSMDESVWQGVIDWMTEHDLLEGTVTPADVMIG